MADTPTTVFRIIKSEVGASNNTWGTKLNTGTDGFENILLDIGGKSSTTGSANAYLFTPSHALVTTLSNGLYVRVKANFSNTAACTFNYNSLGAQSIKKLIDGILTDPAADDIPSGHWMELHYVTATADWLLENPATAQLIGTKAQLRFGTATDRFPAIDQFWAAFEEVTLTDAATIAWDLSTGINFKVTLTGNRTQGFPTNLTLGKFGRVRYSASGAQRTIGFAANFHGPGGAGDTVAISVGYSLIVHYFVSTASVIYLTSETTILA